jgi:hypothetical protein
MIYTVKSLANLILVGIGLYMTYRFSPRLVYRKKDNLVVTKNWYNTNVEILNGVNV